MDGLSDDYNNYDIINQWHRLFKEQNCIHSDQKYRYWKYVQQYGLPNNKNEKWKHIPLNKLFSHTFTNADFNIDISELKRDHHSLHFKSYRLVFVDGFFSKKLSNQNIEPWEIKILSRNDHQILPEPIKPEIFLYLTECLSQETIYITLPHNTISNIPLYLLHINHGSNDQKKLITIHYRHHIEICNNSQGQIIEHYTSVNENKHFSGSRTSITINDNAQIEYTKLLFEGRNSFHISHDDIHTNYNSIIQSNIFNIFGSNFTHHQTSALLQNKLASLSLNSLSLPIEQDSNSISTYVKHNSPGYNKSKQLHKIISGNESTGIFHGIIKVSKQAIKVNGSMINKNLLLHQSSKIFSMPQLEIYTDDIVCNHGATVGSIDIEQIFYLCTRGITYQEAYQMLICAFAFEVIEVINNKYIQKNIFNRINNILTRTFCNDISNRGNSI